MVTMHPIYTSNTTLQLRSTLTLWKINCATTDKKSRDSNRTLTYAACASFYLLAQRSASSTGRSVSSYLACVKLQTRDEEDCELAFKNGAWVWGKCLRLNVSKHEILLNFI